jgi:hypothetical protein
MRRAIMVATVAAFGLVGSAFGEEGTLSYSYLEGGYVHSELDDVDFEGDGFGIRGSFAFTKNVHGFAQYSNLDYDFDISSDEYTIGAGVNFALSPRLDVVGRVGYVGVELDAPGISSVDDSGVGVGAELRGLVTDTFELHGGVSYVNLNDSGDDTAGNVGARFYVTKMFALGADASFNEDGTTWMLGARVDFAGR